MTESIPEVAQQALWYMEARLKAVAMPALYRLVHDAVLDNHDFGCWPASTSKHHAYEGGLAVHTSEVLRYALAAADPPTLRVDLVILTVSAIMHDFCKILDYEKRGGKWVNAQYRYLVRHVSGSHAEFCRLFGSPVTDTFGTMAQRGGGLSEAQYLGIQHCLLSHHGRQEFGSPVEPQTIEALLLHQADEVSAQFGARKTL